MYHSWFCPSLCRHSPWSEGPCYYHRSLLLLSVDVIVVTELDRGWPETGDQVGCVLTPRWGPSLSLPSLTRPPISHEPEKHCNLWKIIRRFSVNHSNQIHTLSRLHDPTRLDLKLKGTKPSIPSFNSIWVPRRVFRDPTRFRYTLWSCDVPTQIIISKTFFFNKQCAKKRNVWTKRNLE